MKTQKHLLHSVFNLSLSLHHLNKRAEDKIGLTIVQWCVLRHLIDHPAASAYELSEVTKLHPSTLTQSLKRLMKKEFIFVSEDPRDSRKKLISLTRKGKEALDSAEQPIEKLTKELSAIESQIVVIESALEKFDGEETIVEN